MENNFLEHISFGMWVMYFLGVLTLFGYSWTVSKESKGVKKYYKLTVPNIIFHLTASLMVFFSWEETGEMLIKKLVTDFDFSNGWHFVFSGLTGMFGSFMVAGLLELGRNLKNWILRAFKGKQ